MKKIYLLIAGLCLLLIFLIVASIVVDIKLANGNSNDPVTTDYGDTDTGKESKNSSNKVNETVNALTEMAVTAKETRIENIANNSYDHEIIITDLGEMVVDATLSETEWQQRIDLGITSENINSANKECAGLFYYDQIEPELRQLYLEIYIALQNHAESFFTCSVDPKDIDYAFNCVMGDHPDIFYTNGYMFTKFTFGDSIVKIEFTPAYTMTAQEAEESMKKVEAIKDAFVSGIDGNANDYEKIRYTYEYVIFNTEYDLNSSQNQNILSVFLNGKSVCQGYAKAFQYLSESLGIQSTLVVGYVGNDEGHAWNMAKCNGKYYYIDCTWGDSSYLENSLSVNNGGINYDYLNITTRELEVTHVIDNFAKLPVCDATEDNYYVKEGLYFKTLEESQISLAFENAKMEERDSVEFKCASKEVYDEMGRFLLEENHIFDYLSSEKESIKFMQNKDLYIYSFPLK